MSVLFKVIFRQVSVLFKVRFRQVSVLFKVKFRQVSVFFPQGRVRQVSVFIQG